jgi:hypothetical protein
MNRICPTRSQGLLRPVLAASGTADQLYPVEHRGRRKFLPQKKLQFCQVGKNFARKFRVPGVGDMVIRVAAWPSDIAGDQSHDEELLLTQLRHQLLQQLQGVAEGALRRHHQVSFDMVPIIFRYTF